MSTARVKPAITGLAVATNRGQIKTVSSRTSNHPAKP